MDREFCSMENVNEIFLHDLLQKLNTSIINITYSIEQYDGKTTLGLVSEMIDTVKEYIDTDTQITSNESLSCAIENTDADIRHLALVAVNNIACIHDAMMEKKSTTFFIRLIELISLESFVEKLKNNIEVREENPALTQKHGIHVKVYRINEDNLDELNSVCASHDVEFIVENNKLIAYVHSQKFDIDNCQYVVTFADQIRIIDEETLHDQYTLNE